jgi:hypothetical protein
MITRRTFIAGAVAVGAVVELRAVAAAQMPASLSLDGATWRAVRAGRAVGIVEWRRYSDSASFDGRGVEYRGGWLFGFETLAEREKMWREMGTTGFRLEELAIFSV